MFATFVYWTFVWVMRVSDSVLHAVLHAEVEKFCLGDTFLTLRIFQH